MKKRISGRLKSVECVSARNKKPPAMRVGNKSYTIESPFQYNRVVQATIKKGKVILKWLTNTIH